MQLSIELPDDFGEKVIEGFDLKQLSQEFIAFILTKKTQFVVPVSQQVIPLPAQTAPITASLTGLLASSVIHEQDYQQYLEDKYL